MPSIIEEMPSNSSNSSQQLVPEKRKGAAILPPNDASRKDWGILSDSLGLSQHATPSAGATPEQAAEEMRDLLLKIAADSKAYEALIMKCAGGSIANKLKEDVAGRTSFDEMIAFVKSRLWNRRHDGAKTESRKGRAHSSNDVIQAWDPIAGGIGKYLQVQVSNILNRDWKQQQMQLSNPRKVSVEVLESKGRHLDNSGQIFDRASAGPGAAMDDETDFVEQDEAFERASAHMAQGRNARGDDVAEEGELAEGEIAEGGEVEEVTSEANNAFLAFLEASKVTKMNASILKTAEHPDFRVLAAALDEDAPEPELDGEGRIKQLRDLCHRAIALHYSDSSELAEMLDAADSWNPTEVTFGRYFPEACEQISRSLDENGNLVLQKQDMQLELAIDFIQVSEELERQSKGITARPPGMSAIEWEDVQDEVGNWFSARCKGAEELLSPDRPDYLALSALTGHKIERNLEPDALAAALKNLYREWMNNALAAARSFDAGNHVLSENYAAVTEMNRRMEDWDPLAHGFANESMVSHLNEIRNEQAEREEERRRAAAEAMLQERKTVASHTIKAKPARIPQIQQSLFADADLTVAQPEPKPLMSPTHSNPTELSR